MAKTKKVQRIRILADYFGTDGFGNRRTLFAAGALYPADDEGAQRQLAVGNADACEVDDVAAEEPAAATGDTSAA